MAVTTIYSVQDQVGKSLDEKNVPTIKRCIWPPIHSDKVIENVLIAKEIYICKYGYEPQVVYLGEETYKGVKAELKNLLVYQNNTRPDRDRIFDMSVYVVDSKDYIGFGVGK